MTLVVGRKSDSGRVRVVADLRVTDGHDLRRGYLIGALKNVILSRTILAAFAGNARYAMHTLRQLPNRPDAVGDVLPVLVESAAQASAGDDAVEYLLAVAGTGIWRIGHSGVEERRATNWIGDDRAFAVYQRGYHSRLLPPAVRLPGLSVEGPLPISDSELEETARISNGIAELAEAGSVPSVGEAFISAVSCNTGFRYEHQAVLHADHEQVIDAQDGWVPADWGSSATGGFGYSVLVPEESGVGLIGLFFPHANLGILYHPLSRDEPFVYRSVSLREFRAHVVADHATLIDGPAFG